MNQLQLFTDIHSTKFPKYHQENPQIYEAFKRVTFEAIKLGHTRFSAEFVFNVIRWKTDVTADDDFKVNNNYKPFYSRMFMNEFPEFKGIFNLRKSKFD